MWTVAPQHHHATNQSIHRLQNLPDATPSVASGLLFRFTPRVSKRVPRQLTTQTTLVLFLILTMSTVPAAAAAALANSSHTPRPSISRSAFSTPAPGTPSGAASRSFSRAPDAAAAANANAATAIPPLPSPATFDLLPQLHILLGRLLIPKPGGVGGQNNTAGGAGQSAQGGTSAGTTTAAAAAASAGGNVQGQPTTAAEAKDPETQPLEIHQLAAAASALKVRLQRARQACARLGDVDRTVEEQEEEMAELETRVAKLRAVLEELGVGRSETGEGAVAPV